MLVRLITKYTNAPIFITETASFVGLKAPSR